MPITKGQGQSDMTPFKQSDLQEFLQLWFRLARNALKNDKRKKYRQTLIYIDTNTIAKYTERKSKWISK